MNLDHVQPVLLWTSIFWLSVYIFTVLCKYSWIASFFVYLAYLEIVDRKFECEATISSSFLSLSLSIFPPEFSWCILIQCKWSRLMMYRPGTFWKSEGGGRGKRRGGGKSGKSGEAGEKLKVNTIWAKKLEIQQLVLVPGLSFGDVQNFFDFDNNPSSKTEQNKCKDANIKVNNVLVSWLPVIEQQYLKWNL